MCFGIIINILNLIFWVGCFGDAPKVNNNPEAENLQIADSSHLITQLYRNVNIISAKEYFDFSYDFSYNPKENTILIKSSKRLDEHKIEYFIVLQNIEEQFNKKNFTPYDDSYKYLSSYFKIDGQKVNLTNIKLSNKDTRLTEPALVWYDESFGISAKHYKLKSKEIFLLRGINLYCNGNQCIDYQIFVIQLQSGHSTANTLYFSGKYPYDFENTFLFDKNADGNPEIFVPKSTRNRELQDISDFEMYTINLSDITKAE